MLLFFVLLSQVLDFFRVDPGRGLSDDQVRLYLILFDNYLMFVYFNLKFKISDCSLSSSLNLTKTISVVCRLCGMLEFLVKTVRVLFLTYILTLV